MWLAWRADGRTHQPSAGHVQLGRPRDRPTSTAQPPSTKGCLGWDLRRHPDRRRRRLHACAELRRQERRCRAPQQRDEERAHGIPPHWNNYVTVASADDDRRAGERAGRQPDDGPRSTCFDAGRMAVLTDPTGAVLCIWEPRGNIGAELVNDPGCADLERALDDRRRARQELLHASCSAGASKTSARPTMPYAIIRNGDRIERRHPAAGRAGAADGRAAELDAVLHVRRRRRRRRKDRRARGQRDGRPDADPAGQPRSPIARDPQGAVFALFEGETED